MDSAMQTLFGPLPEKYCVYFYILAIIGFISFAVVILGTIVSGVSKRLGLMHYISGLSIALVYGLFYFQSRLLHTMCVGSA
jgi:membrane-bound acyltransferase YfiQ involved in biofilm formation